MQFVIKKMKPVLTVGIIVTFKPSADINDSFCVSNPKPKPTSKLNDGPAKHAAILVNPQENMRRQTFEKQNNERVVIWLCAVSSPHVCKSPLSKRSIGCPIADGISPR